MSESEEQLELSYLKNLINRILDDTAQPFIRKETVCPHGDIRPEKLAFIHDLEQRGIARILGTPDSLSAEDYILEMLRLIDRPTSIPGFLE